MVSPDLGQIDLASHAFIRRLANLLRRRRRERQLLRWQLARRSGGAFTSRQLHDLEFGQAAIDGVDLRALAALYDVDLATIFPERMHLDVDLAGGALQTSGVSTSFDPYDETSLLTSYLRLVRDLRDQHAEPTIELRRDDVEVLASTLGVDARIVIDRLGALMGSTVTQRRAAVASFVAGAVVIVLAGGAAAATSPGDGHDAFQDALGPPAISIVVDEDDQPTDALAPNGVAPSPAQQAAAASAPTPTLADQGVVSVQGSSNHITVDGETGSLTFAGSGERRALLDMDPVKQAAITLTGTQMTRGNGWGVIVHGGVDDQGRFEGFTVQLDPGLGNRLVVRHWGQDHEHAPIASESANFNLRDVLDVTVEVDGPELRVLVNGVEELYVGSLHQAAAQTNSPHAVRTSGVFGLRAWSDTDLTIAGVQLRLP